MSFSEKMDVLDLIISTLKEHEKKLSGAAEILEQVAKHSLDAEKLNKLEEIIVFKRVGYLDGKELGVHLSTSRVLEDLDKMLELIRR